MSRRRRAYALSSGSRPSCASSAGVFFFADGRIEQERISVRTLAKRPLVDADVADAGGARLVTARLFFAGECSPQ